MAKGIFRKNEKMLACSIPGETANQLRLLALFHDTTQSAIIKYLIEKRLEEDVPIDKIVNELAQRAYDRWKKDGGERHFSFKKYIELLQETLIKKGIGTEYIGVILRQITLSHDQEI